MSSERIAFLSQMVEVLTSTVSFAERLGNMVHLLARFLKVDLALYFGLDKTKESLSLQISSQGPLPPKLRVEYQTGQGVVGAAAKTRQPQVVHRDQPGVVTDNAPLEKLQPNFNTLAAFPVADDNFLYGVLLLVNNAVRSFTPAELHSVHLTCLMLAGALRQGLVQEEAKKRIAELSVLFEVGKAISGTVELDDLLERIVSTTAKVINARGAVLQIIDNETGKTRVSSQYGLVPAAKICPPIPGAAEAAGAGAEMPFLQGQTSDAKGKVHFYLGVPLIFKGHLQGTLCVFDKIGPAGEPQPFDPENRQLMFTMAGLIVNALENALTYQQVETLAERNERMVRNLTALQEVSQAMLTTVQEERLLDIIIQGLIQPTGLGFDRVQILEVDEESQVLRGRKGATRPPDSPTLPLSEALFLPLAAEVPVSDWQIPISPGLGAMAQAVLRMRPVHHSSQQPANKGASLGSGSFEASEYYVVPLVVKDRATGIIVVDNQASGRPLEPEPLHALQMLATQAALMLENAHLYSTIEANNRELMLIRERMLESDRLAALSSLASGMAHEIRNPLVSIGGFARRIAKLVDKNSPLRGYVEVIQEEVSRLEKLLREILDFTGENLSYFGDHNLDQLIEDTLPLIQRDLEAANIKVVTDLQPVPRIHCDDRQIKQVFYNLFQNARQAMQEKGGTLTITTFTQEREDGIYAAAAVSDTGGGIPLDVLHNIFNPFFSTKDYGTGLGLSIAQRIIARHYGHIEVKNELGKGVTFIVTLPIAKYCLVKDSAQGTARASALNAPSGGRR
jgi:two-component system sensor histidine kinase HydH|uniref:histidine kinase n=1 Tax=Desulfobacca acetoxidans TaxID=60893 RepID=A0A7V6A4D3_9BACT